MFGFDLDSAAIKEFGHMFRDGDISDPNKDLNKILTGRAIRANDAHSVIVTRANDTIVDAGGYKQRAEFLGNKPTPGSSAGASKSTSYNETNPIPIKYVGMMTNARVLEIINETFEKCLKLRATKGMEYTGGSNDALYNFRSNGLEVGLPMEVIWRIYAGKHWNSITTYVKDLVSGTARTRGEPIAGRVDDMITYLLLFKAILEERGEK